MQHGMSKSQLVPVHACVRRVLESVSWCTAMLYCVPWCSLLCCVRCAVLCADRTKGGPTAAPPEPSRSAAHALDAADPKGWRPRGVLVSSLQEHRASVNKIAVSRDN